GKHPGKAAGKVAVGLGSESRKSEGLVHRNDLAEPESTAIESVPLAFSKRCEHLPDTCWRPGAAIDPRWRNELGRRSYSTGWRTDPTAMSRALSNGATTTTSTCSSRAPRPEPVYEKGFTNRLSAIQATSFFLPFCTYHPEKPFALRVYRSYNQRAFGVS